MASALDRTVFFPLKSAYHSACDDIMNDPKQTNATIGHQNFCSLLKIAWNKSLTIENIVSGFRACGIVPYNPEAIPNEAYLPNYLYAVSEIVRDQTLIAESLQTCDQIMQNIDSTNKQDNISARNQLPITEYKDVVRSGDLCSNNKLTEYPISQENTYYNQDGYRMETQANHNQCNSHLIDKFNLDTTTQSTLKTITDDSSFMLNKPNELNHPFDRMINQKYHSLVNDYTENEQEENVLFSTSTTLPRSTIQDSKQSNYMKNINELSTEKLSIPCSSELALHALSLAIPTEKLNYYEKCYYNGNHIINDQMYQTWKKYKNEVEKGNMLNKENIATDFNKGDNSTITTDVLDSNRFGNECLTPHETLTEISTNYDQHKKKNDNVTNFKDNRPTLTQFHTDGISCFSFYRSNSKCSSVKLSTDSPNLSMSKKDLNNAVLNPEKNYSDEDILPSPVRPTVSNMPKNKMKKGQKYFVLTAEEVYESKLQSIREKKDKEQKKQDLITKRLHLKEKKAQELKENKKPQRSARKVTENKK